MHYVVIDLETSIKNRGEESIGKFKASPFHPENKIVYMAMGFRPGSHAEKSLGNSEVFKWDPDKLWPNTKEEYMIVGQNIKFDLLYLMLQAKEFRDTFCRTGHVWDIQLAEYLLSGQVHRNQSLDQMCERYGLELKDDKIKAYWDADVDTEDIPEAEIIPYAKHDVEVTNKIFQKQLEKAGELGMLPLIATQMDALMATCEMEYNGMRFDKEAASKDLARYEALFALHKAELSLNVLTTYSPWHAPWTTSKEFNPMSNEQLSAILFGGEVKYTTPVEVVEDGKLVRYKTGKRSGEVKTRQTKFSTKIEGMLPESYKLLSIPNAKGYHKVDEQVLNTVRDMAMLDDDDLSTAVDTINTVLKIKSISKSIGTYYKPYTELVWHDGCIHPKYNHANTVTGRLSSSSPNLQNVNSKSEV